MDQKILKVKTRKHKTKKKKKTEEKPLSQWYWQLFFKYDTKNTSKKSKKKN